MLAHLIAALPLLVSAIRAALETWRLAQELDDDGPEGGSPEQLVTSALTALRQALAAGVRIRDAVAELVERGIEIPDLLELEALIDQVELLPDRAPRNLSNDSED